MLPDIVNNDNDVDIFNNEWETDDTAVEKMMLCYKLLWFQYTCSVDKTKNINCFDEGIFGRGFMFNCLI